MLLKHLANVLIYVSYHLKVEERINSNRTLRPAKTKLCATLYEINDKAGNVAQWQTACLGCVRPWVLSLPSTIPHLPKSDDISLGYCKLNLTLSNSQNRTLHLKLNYRP